jgi:hypothetical protein
MAILLYVSKFAMIAESIIIVGCSPLKRQTINHNSSNERFFLSRSSYLVIPTGCALDISAFA